MERITGIYKIQSIIKPERIYIGSAVYVDKRWKEHLKWFKNPQERQRVSDGLKRYYILKRLNKVA